MMGGGMMRKDTMMKKRWKDPSTTKKNSLWLKRKKPK
jgi:hypothetical protein